MRMPANCWQHSFRTAGFSAFATITIGVLGGGVFWHDMLDTTLFAPFSDNLTGFALQRAMSWRKRRLLPRFG